MDLLVNGTERFSFSTEREIEDFFQDERHKWHWLTKLPPQLNKAAKELQRILLDEPIINARGTAEITGTGNGLFRLGDAERPFITNSSEEGRFVDEVLNSYGCVVGYYSIIYSNDRVRHMAYNNSAISESLRMPSYEYDRFTAMNLSFSLGDNDRFVTNRRDSEFQRVLERQRSDQEQFRENYANITKEYMGVVASHHAQTQQNVDVARKTLRRQMRAVKVLAHRGVKNVKEATRSANDKYDAAIARLDAADDAYTEQLDLRHSVTYWKGRSIVHSRAKYGWLVGVLVSLAFMLLSVGAYFAAGGLTEISKNLHDYYAQPVVKDSNQSADTASTDRLDSAKSPGNESSDHMSEVLTKSDVVSLATNLTGAILLITLLSIIIRIALRQFGIHTQYALEAGERVAFIKTYLALMQEKQIKADEDRKLILECIFKPTLGASAPEIAFTLPVESIVKALSDRKSVS
ncbi:hypothetical protein [Pseudomonas qingdaonensis]|uniref:hypothetical protein n=1 Tax=Pseudomonas qingdaonensis TaxID=2056231 RepID=UPI001F4772FF|nr:hypothetical protein [Pseudomonas qingdaonensis]